MIKTAVVLNVTLVMQSARGEGASFPRAAVPFSSSASYPPSMNCFDLFARPFTCSWMIFYMFLYTSIKLLLTHCKVFLTNSPQHPQFQSLIFKVFLDIRHFSYHPVSLIMCVVDAINSEQINKPKKYIQYIWKKTVKVVDQNFPINDSLCVCLMCRFILWHVLPSFVLPINLSSWTWVM